MGKSTHFFGQPLLSQVIKLTGREKTRRISQELGGERYVRRIDCWTRLTVMLYAVIMRFDSLRETAASMQAEARKLCHLGIRMMPSRGTLAGADRRRPSDVFEAICRYLYATYRRQLSSDSRRGGAPKRMSRLQIIDFTTVTLFSNLLLKGAGRNPKSGRKKGGIKVHTVIHANEGVPSDVRLTSAATHDSFMLRPADMLSKGDIIAMDRAYMDYGRLEEITRIGAFYVTKMKKGLKYEILEDTMWQTPEGLAEVRLTCVRFTKQRPDGSRIEHEARIITYPDAEKHKLVSLLTNDMEAAPEEIIAIYRQRWEIELLFKQIKQNFPPEILLRRERQRHQDTLKGTLPACTPVELLRTRHDGQDNPDVLR